MATDPTLTAAALCGCVLADADQQQLQNACSSCHPRTNSAVDGRVLAVRRKGVCRVLCAVCFVLCAETRIAFVAVLSFGRMWGAPYKYEIRHIACARINTAMGRILYPNCRTVQQWPTLSFGLKTSRRFTPRKVLDFRRYTSHGKACMAASPV